MARVRSVRQSIALLRSHAHHNAGQGPQFIVYGSVGVDAARTPRVC